MGTEKSQVKKRKKREAGLPVTLQALRDRAGLGLTDGASPELREFFAESKFSGDPDRATAVAMVAVDAIIRDPSMLDATTCFGEGQIDTAVGAAKLVLGERNLGSLCEIRGENDLEQLSEKCRALTNDRDVKAGCMAARHLWGMFNTALRTFPTILFRNGSHDDFQAALLAVAGRHLGIFSPDSDNLQGDFLNMISKAERIAELGAGGKKHAEPSGEKEASETILHLVKSGKFCEIRDSSIVDLVEGGGQPSTKVTKLLGIKRGVAKAAKQTKADVDWADEGVLAGNGAFFAGRTYEEVKARYPGYPGHSTEASYWDSCTRHPATHGICSRLYSKVPLLTRVGGVEEGLSRAVTNKLVHHNTKFSRLSLWVNLSNGKGFWVHRTRPINWASHGVYSNPLSGGDGQMELFTGGGESRKKIRKGQEEVTVAGFELKAMNYSHMPWVNKAISQYVEEAPFISSPTDEHQTCLSILSKALREGGSPYRDAVEKAADIYSLLPGRGRSAAEALSQSITDTLSGGEDAGDCEASLAAMLRNGEVDGGVKKGVEEGGLSRTLSRAAEAARAALQNGVQMLERMGVSPTKAATAIPVLAGRYPVRGAEDPSEVRKTLGKSADRISDRDLDALAREVTGLAARCTKNAFLLQDSEIAEISELVGGVMNSGVFEGHKVDNPDKGVQAEAVLNYINRAAAMGVIRGLDQPQADSLALSTLREAVNIGAEIEIRLAHSGAILGDKERDTLFAYCAKHFKAKPLTAQDMHNRIASYGGGLTVSLDAPVGEDGKDDLYSVFSAGAEHDPEEEAFGGGEIPHWLDSEATEGKKADSGRPGFILDGGDELFSSFGVDGMAEDLYRVVSTKGDAVQRGLLENFASLNVEAFSSRGGALSAKEQVASMLDLLDREEELARDDASVRRKALTWVFQSVLNAVGSDREGFDKLGGAGGSRVRDALYDKVRRYGMPGVLVRAGEPEPNKELGAELSRLKTWGYCRVGISLPAEAGEPFSKWAAGGGVLPLLQGVSNLGEDFTQRLKSELGRRDDGAAAKAAKAVLGGEDDRGRLEGEKYLVSRPDAEAQVFEAVGRADAALHKRLQVLKMSVDRGLAVDFVGGGGAHGIADSARLDSILMVQAHEAADVSRRLGEFGISSCVVSGGVDGVVRRHPDYEILGRDGADREMHLLKSQIPLPRRLVMAAMAAHETAVKE
jgi:hypothetical protein